MAEKKESTAITFRCDNDTLNKLDELCRIAGIKRSEFFIEVIDAQYDKVQGNPELKEVLEQMKQISKIMEKYTNKSKWLEETDDC